MTNPEVILGLIVLMVLIIIAVGVSKFDRKDLESVRPKRNRSEQKASM